VTYWYSSLLLCTVQCSYNRVNAAVMNSDIIILLCVCVLAIVERATWRFFRFPKKGALLNYVICCLAVACNNLSLMTSSS